MYEKRISFSGILTKTVIGIIVINTLFFLAQNIYKDLTPFLALITGDVFPYRIYTLFTYSLLHGSLSHLFFNMLSLYFFAGSLQIYTGVKRFLVIYIGSAIAGGIFSLFFPHGYAVIGASASVLGVLTAYSIYFPSSKVLLFFIIPLPVRHFIYLLMALSIYFSVFGGGGNVAHIAHLGGIVFAFVYCNNLWNLKRFYQEIRYKIRKRKFQRLK
ncbi:MAG: rhomboid family intramembrane serine protease [Acidobacteria bacterium]|nr:rhomboid family intramembrane serine protease [Acidobacteriota bacterium]